MTHQRAIDRAAALWSHASVLDADGRTASGDPDAVGDSRRRAPVIPSVEEIASWGDQPTTDLNQMVTDSGAIPAGCVSWTNLPSNVLWPNGSPAGDAMAFLKQAGVEPTPLERTLIEAAAAQAEDLMFKVVGPITGGALVYDPDDPPPAAS